MNVLKLILKLIPKLIPALPLRLLLLAATLQLTGCATVPEEANRDQRVQNTWLGATYEDVVRRWGTPVRSTSFNDGRLVYTWYTEGIVPRRDVWPSYGIYGNRGLGGGIDHSAYREVQVSCERTLIFKEGRVAEQTWIGVSSFCDQFGRS
jgi:hypothetical protein